MSIIDVPRNDLTQAVAYYLSRGSQVSPDEMEMLSMLQDDPTAFEELSADWNVVEELPVTPAA